MCSGVNGCSQDLMCGQELMRCGQVGLGVVRSLMRCEQAFMGGVVSCQWVWSGINDVFRY